MQKFFSGFTPCNYISSIKLAYFTSYVDGAELSHIKGQISVGA